MLFKELKIKGSFVISSTPYSDNRGVFRRNFCKIEFKNFFLNNSISQANISENIYKYTLRGFHYQIGKNAEAKTISCLNGKAYDIICDLRPNSQTYLKWVSVIISSENRKSIHIPKGCANAFLTLEKNSILHYYSSNKYKPLSERGIKFDDKLFKFKWPHKPKYISQKDLRWKDFKI